MPANRKLINNPELSLLKRLKELKSPFRITELPELIQCCQFSSNQLKAVLFLFPKEDRYGAFKLLIRHFDINLSVFTDSERKQLTVCLATDPVFNKLLPFAKKNFGVVSLVREDIKRVIPYPLVERDIKPSKNFKQSNNLLPSIKVNSNKSTLKNLRIALMNNRNSASKLNFFKSLEIKKSYQALLEYMSVEEFKSFIEIFPPNDAIKFLNLSFIRDQVKSLQRQNNQLSKESYVDLLNYFKPYQRDAVKQLLRPISINIDIKLLRQQGIFKEEKNITPKKTKLLDQLPDIVVGHNH